MQPGSNYTYISTATTTVVGGSSLRRVNLVGISINKALVGIVTVKSGATTIGIFAAATPVGMQWYTDGGVEIADLQIVTASADDVTVFWNNL